MEKFLKKVFLNNVQLKLFSLFLGYIFWSIISESHADKTWVDVPVCFYQAENHAMIEAPEMVKVSLMGKRRDLRSLDTTKTAVHIDTRTLKNGKQTVALSEKNIMLPENVQISQWAPEKITVELKA